MLFGLDAAAATLSLPRFVEDVHLLVPTAEHARYDRLPDGRTTLVVRVLEERQAGDVCVVGPRTRALFKDVGGVAQAIIVQLKPGWSTPLFGLPTNALTDRIVPLEDIWGRAGRELTLELLATRSLTEVVDVAARGIGARVHHRHELASAGLARRAVHLLEGGETRVERAAKHLGVTARHLRRAFKRSIGVGPKDFARSVRLRRAVRMAATSRDWARIATEAGYYDQAHLIADFHKLVGLTPSDFIEQIVEPPRTSARTRRPQDLRRRSLQRVPIG